MFNPILQRRQEVINRIQKSVVVDEEEFDLIQIPFGVSVEKAFEDELEKARTGVYADNTENRRLGRVGLKYEQGYRRGAKVTATLPTGRQINGTFHEFYGHGGKYVSIKGDDGHMYGVIPAKVSKQGGEKKAVTAEDKEQRKKEMMVKRAKLQIKQLRNQREEVSLDMEDALSQEAWTMADKEGISFSEAMEKVAYDGNNPTVVEYGKQLAKIDDKIAKLQSKINLTQ